MNLLPYVIAILVGIVYFGVVRIERMNGNTWRGTLLWFVDSVHRSEQEKADARACRAETVAAMRCVFGISEEDMHRLDVEPVRNRLRMLVWCHVHRLALQLTVVNEFKRHAREMEFGKEGRTGIATERGPIIDDVLALIVAISDALYDEFQSALFVAARHPAFRDLFLLYGGEDADRICPEPQRFLTHGEFLMVHPQWVFAHEEPCRAIQEEMNKPGSVVDTIERCLRTRWSSVPHDEIVVRLRDMVRQREHATA